MSFKVEQIIRPIRLLENFDHYFCSINYYIIEYDKWHYFITSHVVIDFRNILLNFDSSQKRKLKISDFICDFLKTAWCKVKKTTAY